MHLSHLIFKVIWLLEKPFFFFNYCYPLGVNAITYFSLLFIVFIVDEPFVLFGVNAYTRFRRRYDTFFDTIELMLTYFNWVYSKWPFFVDGA